MLCWMESDLVNKPEKLFGKGNESDYFYNIYWKPLSNYVLKRCKGRYLQEFHMKYCTNSNIYNSVISFLLSKCVKDTFVIGQISDH